MQHNHPLLVKTRHYLDHGLVAVEIIALIATGIATTVAIAAEIWIMINRGSVTLADLLLMFLYLEVLAMIGQYLRTGQIQVRFPLYIAMVALARYLIIEVKEIEEWRILAISGSILLLTLAVLVVRYGHRKYPYDELRSEVDSDSGNKTDFARESAHDSVDRK
ncbi:MAG: phosphate-starvation-inducible PsiE family protein [Granulosicoccus sp.]|nr:phosphate-starvation-inducible PsiE family protein [Granulosicoccus sp.]